MELLIVLAVSLAVLLAGPLHQEVEGRPLTSGNGVLTLKSLLEPSASGGRNGSSLWSNCSK